MKRTKARYKLLLTPMLAKRIIQAQRGPETEKSIQKTGLITQIQSRRRKEKVVAALRPK
jgi:hypothetical protein